MLRLTLASTGLAALAFAALAANPGQDYTSIPPDPARTEQQLRAAGVTLAQAVEAACKKTDGVASSATLKTDAEGQPHFEVLVYGGGKAHRVSVDSKGEAGAPVEIPRFPGEPVSGAWTETASGLKYYDLQVGSGAKPSGPTAVVKVHYTGWFVDGTQFDSSRTSGKPIDFALNQVIRGWTEGVGSMQVGGRRKLIIPYNLAYGESGRPGIPPKATLVFDVELLDAK